MLYLCLAKNRQDFLKSSEENMPLIIRKILIFFRKNFGIPVIDNIDGKGVVFISKFNKKVQKRLDKIFKIDVTKNVCICDSLKENKNFLDYINSKDFTIFDGRWILRYLVNDIAKFICNDKKLIPEKEEISILTNKIDSLIFETIERLAKSFKNINIITTKIQDFEKLKEKLSEETGLILNITNNFKKAGLKSKIVFNFDFDEKELNKVRFLPDSSVVNLNKKNKIRQGNFKGKSIDLVTINLPRKYKKLYNRLNDFNSCVLYESFIYKKTSPQNIWDEIKKDNVKIVWI